jgi:hypothetical protein
MALKHISKSLFISSFFSKSSNFLANLISNKISTPVSNLHLSPSLILCSLQLESARVSPSSLPRAVQLPSAFYCVSHAKASPSFPSSPYIMPSLNDWVEESAYSGARAEAEDGDRGTQDKARAEPKLKTANKGNWRRWQRGRSISGTRAS